jgi:peptide/nickel transport system ATP-binding protein
MTPPLIETRALTREFQITSGAFASRSRLTAVDAVDIQLRPGETLGLAGESGCGKSTVARLLTGILPPTSGSILYKGIDLTKLGKEQFTTYRKDVQMIFQDPFSSLNPRMWVGDIIGEPLGIHKLATGQAKRDRVVHLMSKVGLSEEHYYRYPHEFSGGQRQRIGIARALAVSPQLIIADEPVSALDLSIQAQIINLLQELKQDLGIAFLFITHDLSVIRHMSDRIAVMYLGKVVETGTRTEVLDRFLHPYTEALLSSVPTVSPVVGKKRIVLPGDIPSPLNPPTGCHFHPRCPYAKDICRVTVPLLEDKEGSHQAACHFSTNLYRQY